MYAYEYVLLYKGKRIQTRSHVLNQRFLVLYLLGLVSNPKQNSMPWKWIYHDSFHKLYSLSHNL